MKIYIVEWFNKGTGAWEPDTSSSIFLEDELDMASDVVYRWSIEDSDNKFRVATYVRVDS